jgi:uncharacterized delta-60 repeat protein
VSENLQVFFIFFFFLISVIKKHINFAKKIMKKKLLLLIIIFFNSNKFYPQITVNLDPSFVTGTGFTNGNNFCAIYKTIHLASGKTLVGGIFNNYNGITVNGIVRLNENGTLDTTFFNSLMLQQGYPNEVICMKVLSDGKILLAGYIPSYQGVYTKNLIRLNTDGTLDTSFNTGAGVYGLVDDLMIQSDSKIIAIGSFDSYNNIITKDIVRINADGSIDTTFNSGGIGVDGYLLDGEILEDGKIIIAGLIYNYNGVPAKNIVRLNTDGTRDLSFDTGLNSFNGNINTFAIQPDGKIVVGGEFTFYNYSVSKKYIVRINTDGSEDTTFITNQAFNNNVQDILLQQDKKMIVAGDFTYNNGLITNRLIRINNDGSVDNSFNIGSGFDNYLINLEKQLDGKLLVSGMFQNYNGINIIRLARFIDSSSLSVNNNSFLISTIYPNPVSSLLKFNLDYNYKASYEIFDFLGKKVISGNLNQNEINVNELSKGVYVLKISTHKGISTTKFVKE